MQSPKTICLLNDSFPPLIDGVANAVKNYAEQITQQGNNAIVVTPKHPDADDSGFQYPVMRYPSVDIRDKVGYLAGVPFSPELASQISNQNVSLLHSHCPIVSTILARQLRQITNAPLVLTYHTKFDIEISTLMHNKLLQTGSKKALIENISACDEIWTVSNGAGESLRSLGYEGEYIVMPNGVDVPRERLSDELIYAATKGYDLPQNVPVYLFVGRMQWYKGQRLILDALSQLSASGKNFRMIFIGDGADREAMLTYADNLGIADRCIFTGAIHDREILRAWYCRADLFLFPSTFDTNGLVVREAAASSLASVLIRNSCASEGVTDGRNGFLIEENAESLAECLLSLYDSSDIVRRVGDAAARELYISWADAVTAANDRYEIVIDNFRRGIYHSHRRPMDTLLKANGELMDDLGHLISLHKQIRQHIYHR